jgi:Tfp pilus assembly protein PilF
MKTVFALLLLSMIPLLGFAVGTGASSSGNSGSARSADNMTADDYYNKGLALSDAGKYSDALPEFQRAVALRTDFAEAYNMIGFTYRKLGKLNLSLRSYEKALKIRPDFPEAYEYLGETYLAADDLVHAMKNYLYLRNGGQKQAQELWEKIVDYVATKARA